MTKPSGKISQDYTSFYGGLFPIFYTQKEPFKIGDAICDKLHQMCPGMPNVLVIYSTSSNHEREDLPEAVTSLSGRIAARDDRFFRKHGYQDASAFAEKASLLSAVLFRSVWKQRGRNRNLIWTNSLASFPLPQELRDFLASMDRPSDSSAVFPAVQNFGQVNQPPSSISCA